MGFVEKGVKMAVRPEKIDSRKLRVLNVGFVLIESVLIYYWVGLMQSSFKLLPGIYYFLQTHFPLFIAYYDYFSPGPGPEFFTQKQFLSAYQQFYGGLDLAVAITIALSIVIPLVVYFYWRRVSRYNKSRQNVIVSNALFAMVYGVLLYSMFQAIFFIFFPPSPSISGYNRYQYVGYVHFPLTISYFIYQVQNTPLAMEIYYPQQIVLDLEYLLAVLSVLLGIAIITHFITLRRLRTRARVQA